MWTTDRSLAVLMEKMSVPEIIETIAEDYGVDIEDVYVDIFKREESGAVKFGFFVKGYVYPVCMQTRRGFFYVWADENPERDDTISGVTLAR